LALRRSLGIGLVTGGAAVIPVVFAQDATPPAAQAPAQTGQGRQSDFEAQRAQAYDDFVAALASELGTGTAKIDAAIRTALKQQVDARQAAGDLAAEQATAIKTAIDASAAPLFSGFGDHDGGHSSEGHRGFEGRGSHGDNDREAQAPGSAEPPSAQSGGEQGTGQSAPAPAAPTASSPIV
jgi:hypothetical protein